MTTPQPVEVSELNLQQLNKIKSQLDDELQLLSSSMSQLKVVQNRLNQSKESVQHMTPEAAGRSVLVPLTSSMYVAGTLLDSSKVLVDIGTGYFVEKTSREAEDFFKRKIDYVTKNLEKMQKVMVDKHRLRETILGVMQQKFSALHSQQ